MPSRTRVVQDSRNKSRITTRLNCRFAHEGSQRDGLILNLSLGGAYISSKHLPSVGSAISLTLHSPVSQSDLKLNGKVIRGNWTISDHGKLARFGIRFSHSSLDLVKLINSLNR